MVDTDTIHKLLEEVKDPEIPVLSIAEMGILDSVIFENGKFEINIIPTYNGCPAMDLIQLEIREKLFGAGIKNYSLHLRKSPPWSTDRMSAEALAKMEAYGIAPPQNNIAIGDLLSGHSRIVCPQCGSSHTEVQSAFGSTACKAMMRCLDCLEPFEYFKCFKIPSAQAQFS
ncbi:MAG TPA: phenylacetate-CoA oxygenase subunit PaaJ [Saprospiraceae bacterium]|nr:phenylacetate-CoA oxygenase subunit PaaJ [Saprospiraceae bacterium]HQW56195.1 phenylacetate-CoA oxygenase subunit PaaJ [Saprospiraceae bacterium]